MFYFFTYVRQPEVEFSGGWVLYSTGNDPQPQMIPKMDRKWSSTASDP